MNSKMNTGIYGYTLILGASLSFVLLLSGCGPSKEEIARAKQQEKYRIKGNVFVATKGGSNYKLALIQVTATRKEVFEQTKAKVVKSINDTARGQLEKEIPPLITTYKELLSKFKEERKKYDAINRQMDSYEKESGVYFALSRLTYYQSDTTQNRAAKDKLYQLALNRREEANKLKPQIEKLRVIGGDISKRLSNLTELRENSTTVFVKILQENGTFSATSDADGNFTLNVVRGDGSPVILSASGRRQVGKDSEDYLWIKEVKLDPEQMETQILLSNNDIVSEVLDGLDFAIPVFNLESLSMQDWVFTKDVKNF